MKSILCMVSTLLLFACSNNKPADKESAHKISTTDSTVQLTADQIKMAGIASALPEMRNIASVLRVTGRIDVPPQNIVSISVPLGGYLRSSNLLPGMHVSKGQTLALMEDPQYIQLQQDYLTAKTRLIYAEQEFNRQKELNASKASSDKIFQQSLAEFNSQQILLNSLAEKLRLIHINPDKLTPGKISRTVSLPSPIDGFVSKVNVNIGKYVNPADAVFEIVNPEDIHLALDVFEKDVNKLFIGQSLIAYTNADPEKKYFCEILLISKDISENKSFKVHCHFEKYDKALLPGMFMNAEIQVKNNKGYVLPADAIVSSDKKQYVFIEQANNHFKMIQVETGATENEFTSIDSMSGDKLNDKKVVVKGAYDILMKMKNTSEE